MQAQKKIFQIFRENGYEARLVGGCVRDLVRGAKPNDWDFCTNATPDKMIEICKAAGFKYYETGLQHGTITIAVDDEYFEVTTLRVDVNTDGRHAEVSFTDDWKLDAERRDFTMNAMMMTESGQLIDFFGGMDDMKNKRLVFVGDANKRIQEDYLRIMRYFRFASRFDMYPEPGNLMVSAIRDNVGGLKKISGERIWAELNKIKDGKAFYLMEVCDVFKTLGIPVTYPSIRLASNILRNTDNNLAAISGLIYDPILNLTQSEYEERVEKLAERMHFSANEMRLLKLGHTLSLESRDDVIRYVHMKKYDQTYADFVADVGSWDKFPVMDFPVTGQHLKAIGYKQGREMGHKLDELRSVWIDEMLAGRSVGVEELLGQTTGLKP